LTAYLHLSRKCYILVATSIKQMNRLSFLKRTVIGVAAAIAGRRAVGNEEDSTYEKLAHGTSYTDTVGYNHIPNKEIKTMKTVLHKAETRGLADHGWLRSRHTFSFANYRNHERMNFGVLRVLNDDIVAGGRGFGTHPHDNMEIVSIPLQGNLQHKDSMGNVAVIKSGDVQAMSAGTGIQHSEYNEFLQIWMFPNKKNVTPRYDQITLDKSKLKNQLHQILSPSYDDDGVTVNQQSWWHMASFEDDTNLSYSLRDKTNGVYAFVIEGDMVIAGQELTKRDGYGIWDTETIDIVGAAGARLLLMEVPMQLS